MLTLNDGRSELWQWDTGRKLTVDDECSQVHFSNKVFGRSIDVDVVGGVAIIPDILLQTEKELTACAFVGTAENGYTKISKVFKVNKRNKPADYVFTPTDQTTLGEILDRIDNLENRPSGDVSKEDIENAVNDYLEKNPVSVDEKDPTVPDWAKQPEKPKYTAAEVGALPNTIAIPVVPSALPNPHKLTFTGAVEAEYDGSKPVEVKIPEGGSGDIKWDLLGEYTIQTDKPVSKIEFTDLPGYTSFIVYFVGTSTSVATGDLSLFVNGSRGGSFSSADGLHKKAVLQLKESWHFYITDNRASSSVAPVQESNGKSNINSPATSLEIKNQYGASNLTKGTVIIYGGK